jgi:hypothetical protein
MGVESRIAVRESEVADPPVTQKAQAVDAVAHSWLHTCSPPQPPPRRLLICKRLFPAHLLGISRGGEPGKNFPASGCMSEPTMALPVCAVAWACVNGREKVMVSSQPKHSLKRERTDWFLDTLVVDRPSRRRWLRRSGLSAAPSPLHLSSHSSWTCQHLSGSIASLTKKGSAAIPHVHRSSW